jgi:hypothetical protein
MGIAHQDEGLEAQGGNRHFEYKSNRDSRRDRNLFEYRLYEPREEVMVVGWGMFLRKSLR